MTEIDSKEIQRIAEAAEDARAEREATAEVYPQVEGAHEVVFARHSVWNRGREVRADGSKLGTRGMITKKGGAQAIEAAQSFKASLREGTDVSVESSPSLVVSPVVLPRTGEEKLLAPQRAVITADIYRRELNDGVAVPSKRVTHGGMKFPLAESGTNELLGDYLEGYREGPLGEYFDLQKKYFGGTTHEFWTAFQTDSLPADMVAALEKCNYWDSLQLAQNITSYLRESLGQMDEADIKAKEGNPEDTKAKSRVKLAISHEDGIDAFKRKLEAYLQEKGETEIAEELKPVLEGGTKENQRFSVAQLPNDETGNVVANFGGDKKVIFNLAEFSQFLDQLRVQKDQEKAARI
jgi:hypothetical protein